MIRLEQACGQRKREIGMLKSERAEFFFMLARVPASSLPVRERGRERKREM